MGSGWGGTICVKKAVLCFECDTAWNSSSNSDSFIFQKQTPLPDTYLPQPFCHWVHCKVVLWQRMSWNRSSKNECFPLEHQRQSKSMLFLSLKYDVIQLLCCLWCFLLCFTVSTYGQQWLLRAILGNHPLTVFPQINCFQVLNNCIRNKLSNPRTHTGTETSWIDTGRQRRMLLSVWYSSYNMFAEISTMSLLKNNTHSNFMRSKQKSCSSKGWVPLT